MASYHVNIVWPPSLECNNYAEITSKFVLAATSASPSDGHSIDDNVPNLEYGTWRLSVRTAQEVIDILTQMTGDRYR